MTTPTTQREADERTEACMQIAHRWAQAAYCKALGKPGEDIDSIKSELCAAIDQSAQQAAPEAPANFCATCGKRLFPASIHTCTPPAATTASASGHPDNGAEYLAPRLLRVAKLAGVQTPEHWTHDQVAEFAPTLLGEIARALQAGDAQVLSREDFDRLLGQYWEIAYDEGRTGESRGTEAQVVLTKLRAALVRAPLPTQADAKDCRKLGGSCGCAFGNCANGLDQPAAAYATPEQAVDVARDADLIELLKAIRPSYGAVGSRDVDVTAQQNRIDRAIELLSRANTTGGSKE